MTFSNPISSHEGVKRGRLSANRQMPVLLARPFSGPYRQPWTRHPTQSQTGNGKVICAPRHRDSEKFEQRLGEVTRKSAIEIDAEMS
jgi:hypothetical protein